MSTTANETSPARARAKARARASALAVGIGSRRGATCVGRPAVASGRPAPRRLSVSRERPHPLGSGEREDAQETDEGEEPHVH